MPISEVRRTELNQERAETLVPELKDILLEGITILEENGWKPFVVQALRTKQMQLALYAQGRETLQNTNKLRKLAGLDSIDIDENSRKVTWTLKSNHLTGRAFDIVNIIDGKAAWEDDEFYKAANEVFKEYGLEWGGSWTSKRDLPHFELT